MKTKKKTTKKKLIKKLPKPISTISLDDLMCFFSFEEFVDTLSNRTNKALEYGKMFLKEDQVIAKSSYSSDKDHFKKTIEQDKHTLELIKALQVSLKEVKKNHKLLGELHFSLGL